MSQGKFKKKRSHYNRQEQEKAEAETMALENSEPLTHPLPCSNSFFRKSFFLPSGTLAAYYSCHYVKFNFDIRLTISNPENPKKMPRKYIRKTQRQSWASQENPVLLILDGHLSHTKNLDVILKARENFVTLLYLPLHTTHKLQPLDVGVMFPFNAYMDQALETWMNKHPRRTVTAFQISSIFREAYLKAAVPTNAINGFRKTGIFHFPFNPETFTDADFIAKGETNELIEEPSAPVTDNTETLREERQENPIPGPSSRPDTVLDSDSQEQNSKIVLHFIAIAIAIAIPKNSLVCHPLAKITNQRSNNKHKSTGTVILTSTPYKKQLEKEKMERAEPEGRKKAKAEARLCKTTTNLHPPF
ncbi:hypothetical protein NQ318_012456 [Aromia moschata]|uniref:DDE-1 domain-containing protein n=1 Tax=Aromia moschata TaxID=1265417 RepID=A0AAV8XJ23_9CUCU|nr:hypothetical protein NQ318_012456 [Aromia moschata]